MLMRCLKIYTRVIGEIHVKHIFAQNRVLGGFLILLSGVIDPWFDYHLPFIITRFEIFMKFF